MNVRSKDPRPGDLVQILIEDSPFYNLPGTVRNVYKDIEKNEITCSVVVHIKDTTEFIRKNVPRAPDGGFHTMIKWPSEGEIIGRRIST